MALGRLIATDGMTSVMSGFSEKSADTSVSHHNPRNRMHGATLRAGRVPLAILITLVTTLTAVAACAGGQRITAPSHPNTPDAAARDVATLASDSTVVTFNINREGQYYFDGEGSINVTFTCSRALGETFYLVATLEQYQREVGWTQSNSSYAFSCLQEGRPQDLFFAPVTTARSFTRGKAIATIRIVDGAPAVIRSTVSQNVKLVAFQP